MQTPTEINCEEPPTTAVPVTIQLRYLRLGAIVGVFTLFLVVIMTPFSKDGVTLDYFLSTAKTKDEQVKIRDDYNSKVSNIVSLFGQPIEWTLGAILPVVFLSLAPERHLQTEPALVSMLAFMGIEMGVKYLISNGIQAVNVQIVAEPIRLIMDPSDLKINTASLDAMLLNTTNVSQLVSEQDINFMTNTVLRNVLAPIVLRTAPVCKRSSNGTDDISQFATGLVQSYGFPVRSWQSMMLPTNEFAYPDIYRVDNATGFSDANLPMPVTTATNLFIHAIHACRYFFRWFDDESVPFNITGLIQQSKTPDIVANDQSIGQSHSVPAVELLKLLPPASSDEIEVKWFLSAAYDLFKSSMASGVNISQEGATMEFSHGDIDDDGNITYDAVTFQVPLRHNFYYRKLIYDSELDVLLEDDNATAYYTNISNAGLVDDIYYDLDISADCGPNPGLCVMSRVQEYDCYGAEYQPDPQIKATAICLDDNGTEGFQIDYSYYAAAGNPLATTLDATWACKNQSSPSMYIVSLGSRIVGDAMYDNPAPDATITSLDKNRSTIVNPRKIYRLTVVRLGWGDPKL